MSLKLLGFHDWEINQINQRNYGFPDNLILSSFTKSVKVFKVSTWLMLLFPRESTTKFGDSLSINSGVERLLEKRERILRFGICLIWSSFRSSIELNERSKCSSELRFHILSIDVRLLLSSLRIFRSFLFNKNDVFAKTIGF